VETTEVEDHLAFWPETPMRWIPVHRHKCPKQQQKQIRNDTAKKDVVTNAASKDTLSEHVLPKVERPLPEQ